MFLRGLVVTSLLRRGAAIAAVLCLLLPIAGCDTLDDDSSYSSDDSGSGDYASSSYDSGSSDSSSSSSSSSDYSSSSTYSSPSYEAPTPAYHNDYSSSDDYTAVQNDLTEADNYHYNNDD